MNIFGLAVSLFFALLVAVSSAQVTGQTVVGVGFNNGSLEKTGGNNWVERRANGDVAFNFKEITRTANEVVLFDNSRDVTLKIDVNANMIFYSDSSQTNLRPLYNIVQLRDGRFYQSANQQTQQSVLQPDLSRNWTSDFGQIHWMAGFYDIEENTLNGTLTFEDRTWIYRGSWGRRSDQDAGNLVKFVFSPDGRSFNGQYIDTERYTKIWNGQLGG